MIAVKGVGLVPIDMFPDLCDAAAPAFPFQAVNDVTFPGLDHLKGHGQAFQPAASSPLKGYAPEAGAVLGQLVQQRAVIFGSFQQGHMLESIQAEAGETPAPAEISAQETAAASGADKDLQRDAFRSAYGSMAGAFQIHAYRFMLVHRIQKLQENFVFQGMYKEAVFHAEGAVLMVKLLGEFISDDPEMAGHLKKRTGVQNLSVGAKPTGEGIVQGEQDGFAGFCFYEQALLFVGIAFSADSLDIKEGFILREQAVRDLFQSAGAAVLKQIQYQKVKDDIVVCEAFGFPDSKQRVSVQKAAVNGKGNAGAAGGVVFAHVRGKPAFQTPSLIVISPGALFLKIVSGFEAVDEEVPDVVPGFWETFYQFVEVGHVSGGSSLRFWMMISILLFSATG